MEKNLSMSSPGLRERKKQKTRWAIQEHAMRLFAQQGYDETTVEQIAAAAEISPSSFFRYFKTKEDLVVQDRYDDMIVDAIVAAPAELGPVPAIRHAFHAVFEDVSAAEMQESMFRGRLALTHPVIRGRALLNMLATTDAMAAALAQRMGRPADDYRVQAICGACMGSLIGAVMRWMEGDLNLTSLERMVDESFDVLEHGV